MGKVDILVGLDKTNSENFFGGAYISQIWIYDFQKKAHFPNQNPIDSIHMEEIVSQNFHIGPSFYFLTKKRGNISEDKFSTFNKTKTRTCIKTLRHRSFYTHFKNGISKFEVNKYKSR